MLVNVQLNVTSINLAIICSKGGEIPINIKIPFTDRIFNVSIPKSINPLDNAYYDGSYVNIFDTDGKKNSSEQLKAYSGWVG